MPLLPMIPAPTEDLLKIIQGCDCKICAYLRTDVLDRPGRLLDFALGIATCPLCDLRKAVVGQGLRVVRRIFTSRQPGLVKK